MYALSYSLAIFRLNNSCAVQSYDWRIRHYSGRCTSYLAHLQVFSFFHLLVCPLTPSRLGSFMENTRPLVRLTWLGSRSRRRRDRSRDHTGFCCRFGTEGTAYLGIEERFRFPEWLGGYREWDY